MRIEWFGSFGDESFVLGIAAKHHAGIHGYKSAMTVVAALANGILRQVVQRDTISEIFLPEAFFRLWLLFLFFLKQLPHYTPLYADSLTWFLRLNDNLSKKSRPVKYVV